MYHSYIFSFNTLRKFKGLLAACLILLALEFGVARQEWIWQLFPNSESGVVDALEDEIIRPVQKPVVVCLGGSRIRDAIVPRDLESHLNLVEGPVLNLGLTRGTAFDSLVLYERNRERLSQAQLLLIGVEDLYATKCFPPNERYRRFASLSDRLGCFDLDDTISLLIGWAWRTHDAREAIGRVPRHLLSKWILGREITPLSFTDDGRVVWWADRGAKGPKEYDVSGEVHRLYRTWSPGGAYLKHIDRLLELAKADGVHTLVIQVPWRDGYVDVLQEEYPQAYEFYRKTLSSISTDVLLYEKGGDIGIAPDCYYDCGHLAPSGARIFTQKLAQVVRDKYPQIVGSRQ